VGLNLGHFARGYSTTRNNATSSKDTDRNLRVGPYVQYYKMLNEQFGLLGTLGGGYQRNVTRRNLIAPDLVTEVKAEGFYANLTPGVIFFPVPKFGISASVGSLGYDWIKEKPTSGSPTTSTFGANFGIDQLQFGGTYYFGR
jgi:hypothetical protein